MLKHSPDDFIMWLELTLESCLAPGVRLDHRLSVVIESEAEGRAQDAAELLQESCARAKQLVRRQEHYDHQHTFCQLFWNCSSTVQAIPAALFIITALITATISVVVHAVGLIDGTGLRHKKDYKPGIFLFTKHVLHISFCTCVQTCKLERNNNSSTSQLWLKTQHYVQ